MKKETLQQVSPKDKDHKRLRWTSIHQEIEQPTRNEEIPRSTQLPTLNYKETENLSRPIKVRRLNQSKALYNEKPRTKCLCG